MEKKWHELITREIVGLNLEVPLIDGTKIRYINLDNAATTPPLNRVAKAVELFLPWYSSVHRGFGYKSQLSTEVYRNARQRLMSFFGANPQQYTAVFVKNTSEGLNKLSYRLPVKEQEVLSSWMEHHSNDLPWRLKKLATFIELTPDGILDLADLERTLKKARPQIKLVTICGASNVTGVINPINTIAELAHYYGAELLIDAAQLAPHYPLKINAPGQEQIDYLTLSAHKLYAPFGSGVVIGPLASFYAGTPEEVGGGTVLAVSREEVVFSPPPDREEVGTPNLIGVFALAIALQWLTENNFPRLSKYEEELTSYAFSRLQTIPGIILYGPSPQHYPRIGVISFNLLGIPHGLVAAYLSFEAGIGVRHGCFCARPYVHHLLGLTNKEIIFYENLVKSGKKCELPGMVRISFGFYNTREEIELLINALQELRKDEGKIKNRYRIDPETGEYLPKESNFKMIIDHQIKNLFEFSST